MYRVLIPVDTSEERALAQAEYVTSLPNAAESVEAYLLFVFTEDSDDLPQEFETFKSASRIGSVRRAQEALEDAGIEVTILEDSGDTEDDISRNPGPTTSTRSFSAAESARRSGKRSSAALPRELFSVRIVRWSSPAAVERNNTLTAGQTRSVACFRRQPSYPERDRSSGMEIRGNPNPTKPSGFSRSWTVR